MNLGPLIPNPTFHVLPGLSFPRGVAYSNPTHKGREEAPPAPGWVGLGHPLQTDPVKSDFSLLVCCPHSLSLDVAEPFFNRRSTVFEFLGTLWGNQIYWPPYSFHELNSQPPSAWGLLFVPSNAGFKYPHRSRKTLAIVSRVS